MCRLDPAPVAHRIDTRGDASRPRPTSTIAKCATARRTTETALASAPAKSATRDAIDVITLGCRLNTFESEVMRQNAAAAGIADAGRPVVVVNTCAVTGEAVRQARQTIRRTARDRPEARIVVTGCAAQIDPDAFAAMPEVAHVIGNDLKMRPETFGALAAGALERVAVNDIMSVRETAGHLEAGFGHRARAYVQVQNGCDHRCTFCIIPFGRGNARSVPMGEVVRQISTLVDAGHAEVVLTGVDLTSYGVDLPGTPKLGDLVAKVLKLVPDLSRLRLSSIDQVEVDPALMDAIAGDVRVMPHLHLSLQSGDDMILKRMKRRHLRDDAIRFCQDVRAVRPDVVFGADIIAGFPTETDAMFANTLDIVTACGLTYLHVFPFSPRDGTPAARMPQVDGPTIRTRAEQLRATGQARLERHLDSRIGSTLRVLVERIDGPRWRGRAEAFEEVEGIVPAGTALATGDIVPARITGRCGRHLAGQLICAGQADGMPAQQRRALAENVADVGGAGRSGSWPDQT